MGYEYKIIAKFTDKQVAEIQDLLLNSTTFDEQYEFDNNTILDFRRPENSGKIPNISIIFENDGIYICQNGSSYLWTDLDQLKDYLEGENIEYKIMDYSD